MNVKDLEISKDLSHEERAAVRGGNTSQVGLNVGGRQSVGSGFLFASPVTQVQGPQINDNTNVYIDTTSITAELSKTANVVGSLDTLIK